MMQMMSLHTFDRTYPADFPSHQRLSPLLSREALRRVAWCTFYLDSMTDGGRYGSHTVDERAFRLQLPCDQESFLGNDAVVTEPLIPGQVDFTDLTVDSLPHASLDMSAYLLRTAAARRRTLQFASRASYQEQTVERLSCDCLALQAELEEVVAALPRRLYFNADNMFLHRDRLTTFLLLHVLRENLFIILGRAALQIYLRDPNKADQVIQTRRSRISRALAVAGLVSEGLNANITFDPHIGIHAYVALEILIFEPRRLASAGEPSDPQAPELTGGITLLLTGIRGIAGRSETINHLYAEAVDRLLRCDCAHLLDPGDLTIIRSKHPLVGQDVAEYDFRDHRGAKLERIALGKRVRTGSTHETHDEVLLDDSITRDGRDSSGPSAAPSPKMTALAPSYPVGPHMVDPTQPSGVSTVSNHSTWMGMESYNLAQFGQSWTELIEPENTDHLPSPLNWLFPLDEWADRTAAFSGRFENA
ncbi:hypothetical protein BDW59DRAFT_182196 [Aspergillus cavernicola]|uniref:Transcription factor domain-containing protein n=1 Tax=Aspergillus cavernicola TaxID=176166 RepID=A0ABR4IVE5_9EURO